MRNIQLLRLIVLIPPPSPVMNTMSQAINSTTIVLIAVARFEPTPEIPIFAKIDVNAAKTAERRANANHISEYFLHKRESYVTDTVILKRLFSMIDETKLLK